LQHILAGPLQSLGEWDLNSDPEDDSGVPVSFYWFLFMGLG